MFQKSSSTLEENAHFSYKDQLLDIAWKPQNKSCEQK